MNNSNLSSLKARDMAFAPTIATVESIALVASCVVAVDCACAAVATKTLCLFSRSLLPIEHDLLDFL